jgi:hypothetical protein
MLELVKGKLRKVKRITQGFCVFPLMLCDCCLICCSSFVHLVDITARNRYGYKSDDILKAAYFFLFFFSQQKYPGDLFGRATAATLVSVPRVLGGRFGQR